MVLRPPDLPTICRELAALHQVAVGTGYLTVQQAHRVGELGKAWEFYRDSQPMNAQGRIDGLLDALESYVVGVA